MVYFADLDSKKEELQNYVNYLKEYVNKADKKEYKGSSRIFMIKNDVLLIRDSYFKIQNRKYYWVIKDDYEKIFNEFINKIESFKNDDK